MEKEVLPIWQPQGYSTHIIAAKIAEKYGIKTSHTGTLDPMAEGVIIILLGETRLKKYEYAHWIKEYEFEIVFGIETDSQDGLGLITRSEKPIEKKLSRNMIQNTLNSFQGNYEQKIPPYSAIKVSGKPLHWWARNNKTHQIEIPTRKGQIKKLQLIDMYEKNIPNWVETNVDSIYKVTGNLRQDLIIKQWQKFKSSYNSNKLSIVKLRVEMTKGLYVRSLAIDIARQLETVGITNNIRRVKNGRYTEENSLTLKKIFGENFKEKYNFDSRQLNT